MDQKRTDYFKVGAKQYKEIRNEYKDGKLPSLLLHVCCGACSCFPLVYLIDLFDITIYFSNSNINTLEEFNKRLDALKQYVLMLNNKFNTNIKIIVDEYKHKEFSTRFVSYTFITFRHISSSSHDSSSTNRNNPSRFIFS